MKWILLSLALLMATATHARAGVELEETARVGVLDGAPEYTFGQISYVTALRDGGVIAADWQLAQLREYDSAGTYEGDFGRAGEGPGEYRQIYGMRVLPNGQLAVLSSPARITLFDVGTRRYLRDFDTQNTLHAPRMLEYDNDGFLYMKATAAKPEPNQEWSFAWIKLDQTGKTVERVPIPQEKASSEVMALQFPEGSRRNFLTETCSTLSPLGYLVSGRNDEYAFTIGTGPDAIRVKRDVPPVRLGREERSQWEAWAEYFNQNWPQKKHYAIPEQKPAFRALYADPDGRIWVYRYVEAIDTHAPPRDPGDQRPIASWREPTVFDVFSAKGQFLGTVELPDFTKVSEAGIVGNNIWGVQSTDEGHQLVHWRVRGLGEPEH